MFYIVVASVLINQPNSGKYLRLILKAYSTDLALYSYNILKLMMDSKIKK